MHPTAVSPAARRAPAVASRRTDLLACFAERLRNLAQVDLLAGRTSRCERRLILARAAEAEFCRRTASAPAGPLDASLFARPGRLIAVGG